MLDAAVVESAPPRVRCSFCGKSKDAVRRMIEGPKVYICNECVEHSQGIIERADDDERPAVSPESDRLIEAINGGWRDYVEADYALRRRIAELEEKEVELAVALDRNNALFQTMRGCESLEAVEDALDAYADDWAAFVAKWKERRTTLSVCERRPQRRMTMGKHVLPDDVYDTLHFSALAFGGVGSDTFGENSWRQDLIAGQGTPCCIYGHAAMLDGALEMNCGLAGDGSGEIGLALAAAGIDADSNDRAVDAVRKRRDMEDGDRISFEDWCQELGVVATRHTFTLQRPSSGDQG